MDRSPRGTVTELNRVVVGNLYAHLWLYARQHGHGRVLLDMHFATDDAPRLATLADIAFVAAPAHTPQPRTLIRAMPNLAVIVQHESEPIDRLLTSVAFFLVNGTPEVWLVRPYQQLVEQHWFDNQRVRTKTNMQVLRAEQVLPDFCVDLREIFTHTRHSHLALEASCCVEHQV